MKPLAVGRSGDQEPSSKNDSDHRFIRGTAKVAASLLLTACAPGSGQDTPTQETRVAVVSTANPNPNTITTTTAPEVVTSPESTVVTVTLPPSTTIGEAKEADAEQEPFFNVNKIINGQKVFDEVVTQPDGTVLLDLPVFASFITDTETDNVTQNILDHKGVMFEVVKYQTNPNIGKDPSFPGEQAIPGEVGIALSFGHRITHIDADRNDDGVGDDGTLESMYENIGEIKVGATLTLTTPDGKIKRYRVLDGGTEPGLAYRIVTDVKQENGDPNYAQTIKYRNQDTAGRKIYSMVACQPKGSAKDRIIVEWVEVE